MTIYRRICLLTIMAFCLVALTGSCKASWTFHPVLDIQWKTLELSIGQQVELTPEITVAADQSTEHLSAKEKQEFDMLSQEKEREFIKTGKLFYESQNNLIASVDDQGVLTGIGIGKTTIIVTFTIPQGQESEMVVEEEIVVSVCPVLPKQIDVDRSSIELTEGETAELQIKVAPENTTDKSVIWNSDNVKVAKIEDGQITAIEPGTVTITVAAYADPSVKAEIQVVVKESLSQPSDRGQKGTSNSSDSGSSNTKPSVSKDNAPAEKQSSTESDNSDTGITIRDEYFMGGWIGDQYYETEEEYQQALKDHGLS